MFALIKKENFPRYEQCVTYPALKDGACFSAKSREASGRVTLLPD